MGVIEDGTVSGNLPSNEAFAIHYPGYPSSTSRAIQTLGGTQSIVKSRSSETKKLALHFRPEDPYSRPAFGDLRPCNAFLLRLSKNKNDCHSLDNTAQNHANLSADIVARVNEAFYFDGMADYQHVVNVHADVARTKKRNWSHVEEPPVSGNSRVKKMEEDDVMMLLPPMFAPKDFPENLILRPSVIRSPKRNEGVVPNSCEMEIESGLAIDFNIKEIPEKVNLEDFMSRDAEQWKWQIVVSKLFDERPIWHKSSIIDRLLDEGLKFSSQMLKRLLLALAYYFSNGPFSKLWIRKGYDPRKDPESRIYQRIDFRVKPAVISNCDPSNDTESKNRWKDLCAFRVFPTKCSTVLQLYELVDDYIQQEIKKPPKQSTCTLRSGWFSESMFDVIRKRVEMKFMSVYHGTGAEKLRKAAFERFERLKKTCMLKDALQPSQEELQESAKGDEDKEQAEVVDEEEEEEYHTDEDEPIEESDADEALDLVDEEELSRQPHLHINSENNSGTYLQELFGSFPSEVDARKMQDNEGSDGEYQILEQDTDGSYSDDDDN